MPYAQESARRQFPLLRHASTIVSFPCPQRVMIFVKPPTSWPQKRTLAPDLRSSFTVAAFVDGSVGKHHYADVARSCRQDSANGPSTA